MEWYFIVLLTIISVHIFSVIIILVAEKCGNPSEGFYQILSCFSVYIPLRIIFYPQRAMYRYSSSIDYYKKHGISRLAYFFGKRVKEKDE